MIAFDPAVVHARALLIIGLIGLIKGIWANAMYR
jgi:hypothetical protein